MLKVTRENEEGQNRFENFEFTYMDETKIFDIMAIDIPPTFPLWNVPDFFQKYAKDFLMGPAVNEPNPNFIAIRLS